MRLGAQLRAPVKSFFTTPIFYVNAAPHIGHLYSMVLADVAHRYSKLSGSPSILSTGTDEHGTKVARAASKAGTDPQVFVNELSAQFRRLADASNIDYERFIRTTDQDHVAEAREMWANLESKGHIYMSKHTGWYCVSDETFYTEADLVENEAGDKISPESGNPVEWYEEENWFFRLSAFREPLIELFEQNPNFVLPRARHRSLLADLRANELPDLSISRPLERCSWGIPVAGSEQTMYVWFEALINYLTVARSSSSSRSLSKWWPGTHIVGKDIVRFHAIYWPAFLLAAGLEPPKQVVVHSHWTLEGAKMSKSKQNVVDPFEAIDRYGLDSVRYVLCHDSTLAHDSPFSYDRLVERHNVNLVNKWGNLASRVCGPKFDIPASLKVLAESLPENAGALRDLCARFAASFEFGRYAQVINEFGMAANVAVQDAEPWVDPTSAKSRRAIGLAADQCRVMALLLQPLCPTYAAKLLDRLGVSPERRSLAFATIGGDLDYGVGANRKGDHVLQRYEATRS